MKTNTVKRLSGLFVTIVLMLVCGPYFSSYILVKPNVTQNKQDVRTVLETSPWIHLPAGTQMDELQVAAIKRVMKSSSNLLVWGLGNDSPFWHHVTDGIVIFIEPVGVWYDKITGKYPYLKVYTVNYTTHNEKSFAKYINNSASWSDLDLRSQLPAVVVQTSWDVILVDAPPGYYSDTPGRYQSIYTSSLLAKNGTHCFVDDYERKVERQFSQKMLGTPVKVINRTPKKHIPANEQAHFIIVKK